VKRYSATLKLGKLEYQERERARDNALQMKDTI